MGNVLSEELAAAMVGLDGFERRRARVLVRRGEAADDVAVARYVVAFAREQQRRFKRSSSRLAVVLGVAFGVAGIGFAVYLLNRSEEAQAVVVAGFSALVLVSGWRTWHTMRHVQSAERLNREYLRRSGAPYVPGGPPIRVYVSPLAFACSLAIHAAIAVVVGGVVSLLLNAEPFSVAKVFSASARGGVGAAIGVVAVGIWARSRNDTSEGPSIDE